MPVSVPPAFNVREPALTFTVPALLNAVSVPLPLMSVVPAPVLLITPPTLLVSVPAPPNVPFASVAFMFTMPPERLVNARLVAFTFTPFPNASVPLLFQVLFTGFAPPDRMFVVREVSSVPVPSIVPPPQLNTLSKVSAEAEVSVPPLRFIAGPLRAKVRAAPKVCVPPVKFRFPAPEPAPVKLMPLLNVRLVLTMSVLAPTA